MSRTPAASASVTRRTSQSVTRPLLARRAATDGVAGGSQAHRAQHCLSTRRVVSSQSIVESRPPLAPLLDVELGQRAGRKGVSAPAQASLRLVWPEPDERRLAMEVLAPLLDDGVRMAASGPEGV